MTFSGPSYRTFYTKKETDRKKREKKKKLRTKRERRIILISFSAIGAKRV